MGKFFEDWYRTAELRIPQDIWTSNGDKTTIHVTIPFDLVKIIPIEFQKGVFEKFMRECGYSTDYYNGKYSIKYAERMLFNTFEELLINFFNHF